MLKSINKNLLFDEVAFDETEEVDDRVDTDKFDANNSSLSSHELN